MIRSTVIEQYVKSSTRPTITVADVALSFEERYQWIFCGLIVKIWQCNVDPIGIFVQSESHPNHTEHLVENPEIDIHNSSFGSLDLNPGSKAQITDCYIDAQFKPRPTLITANNSDVSIQNCHFGNFINKNSSTVLYGHYYSHIIIENSVFIQHNSSKGVLFLENNCNMFMNNSTHSHNMASSSGHCPVSLKDGIQAVMINTVFSNNSALVGGAVIAQDECRVALTNCTFFLNKAITEKALSISKNPNIQRSTGTPNQNATRTVASMSPSLFNEESSDGRKPKTIATHLLQRSPILKKKFVQQEDGLFEPDPGQGGTIYVTIQSQLLVTNCTFEDNSAQSWGGAIITLSNTMLRVQETTFVGNKAQYAGAICAAGNATLHIEETTFVGNKAPSDGGAINIQQQAHLRIINCVLDENISEGLGSAITASHNATLHIEQTTFVGNKAPLGGAIYAGQNTTLHIEETTFVGNKALHEGGAIYINRQSQLLVTKCTFEENSAQLMAGAILASQNATLKIERTTFVSNKALRDGGAINIQGQAHLRMTNCVLEDNISQRLGGAISAGYNATLEMQETNFTRYNAAVGGGAISVGEQSYLGATDCTFKDNRAEKIGGAIVGGLQVVLEINRSYFLKNSASEAGAINVQQQANLSLTNCRLERNFAQSTGGAIVAYSNVILRIREANFTGNGAFHGGGALCVSTLTDCYIVRCVFNCNTAKGSGGAVYAVSKSSVQVENTSFIYNNATDGGAIGIDSHSNLQTNMCIFWKNLGKRTGGAIKLNDNSAAIIESCHFLSNHAVTGGAVDINSPKQVSVLSTLLLRNIASDKGGAMSISNGADVIINNITCIGNQGPSGGGCLYIDSGTLTLNNSDISENFAYTFGTGVDALYSRIQVGA